MAKKKKNKMILVKTSALNDDELDAAIDHTLDTLFGGAKNQKPAKKIKPIARKSSSKERVPRKQSGRGD